MEMIEKSESWDRCKVCDKGKEGEGTAGGETSLNINQDKPFESLMPSLETFSLCYNFEIQIEQKTLL